MIPEITINLPSGSKERQEDETHSFSDQETEDEGSYEDQVEDENSSFSDQEVQEEDITMRLRNRDNIRPPERYNEFVTLLMEEVPKVPETYDEAIHLQDAKSWKQAMVEEIEALNNNETWKLKELPKEHKALPCKWVFKLKENPDGTIERYKARLVVKGFAQPKNIDYDETFSPVAKLRTVRKILSIAFKNHMKLAHFDVFTAFLYGKLNQNEEIYIQQPEGFEDDSGRVCKLKRSLYGLKQAARCWHEHIVKFFDRLKFKQSTADPCLFIK